MIMSYADCCALSQKCGSSKFVNQSAPNNLKSERYDRCTSPSCMFCKETSRTDHLPTAELSQEIRKIPYRIMCQSIGATKDVVQISDGDSFIQNGFKVEDFEGYYTNGFNECVKQLVIKPSSKATSAIVEIQDRAQQTEEPITAISTLRAKDPYYLSINSMIFGDHGIAVPKWKQQEFCAAAENFALFGRMHDECGDGDTKPQMSATKPRAVEQIESVKRQPEHHGQQQAMRSKSVQRFAPMFAPPVPMPPPMHPAPSFHYNQAVLRTNPFGMSRLLAKPPAPSVYYRMPASYNCYAQPKASADTFDDSKIVGRKRK